MFEVKGLRYYVKNFHKCMVLNKEGWVNTETTNCYAYALGLDIPSYNISYNAYNVGTFCNNDLPRPLSYEDFYDLLYDDLKALKINFKEVDVRYVPDEDEWMIAVFLKFYWDHDRIRDYHFLRRMDNGVWSHKVGYYEDVSSKDDNNCLIYDPSNCSISDYEYEKCFALSLKKKRKRI